MLLALPLMHNFPLVNGLPGVQVSGGTVVLRESLAPESILQTISKNMRIALLQFPSSSIV
jgi:non-ribosomal peptide synthetase component E (peptide arylation enzyme)